MSLFNPFKIVTRAIGLPDIAAKIIFPVGAVADIAGSAVVSTIGRSLSRLQAVPQSGMAAGQPAPPVQNIYQPPSQSVAQPIYPQIYPQYAPSYSGSYLSQPYDYGGAQWAYSTSPEISFQETSPVSDWTYWVRPE